MFGLSFGELCVLIIVAIVVIGPKDMPKVLRKAGQLAGKIRRMASDVRTQSGIDEVLRADGLHEDIAEIRKLAQADFLAPVARTGGRISSSLADGAYPEAGDPRPVNEYPREGADSYDAVPDSAFLYSTTSSPSHLALDPLYVVGDPDAVVTPPPAAEAPATAALAAPAEETAPPSSPSPVDAPPERPGAGGPS